jgi:RNA polymerase sigma factor (sigma-70 family)
MVEVPSNPDPSDAFRERLGDLYTRHHGFVRRTCRRYVQNRDDADDLAQEVLIKAACRAGLGGADAWNEGVPEFPEAASPGRTSAWLYRVACNHCADHARRRRRHGDRLLLYAARLEKEPPNPEPEELVPALTRVLAELRDGFYGRERHIVHLHFDVGMRQDNIARITGISRAGVARRLAKIRERAIRLWRRHSRDG